MPIHLPQKPMPVAPAQARQQGQQAAMSQFGIAQERAGLAQKLHAGGMGPAIAGGLPGLNPQQQSNLRRDFMESMDLLAMPQFSKANIRVAHFLLG